MKIAVADGQWIIFQRVKQDPDQEKLNNFDAVCRTFCWGSGHVDPSAFPGGPGCAGRGVEEPRLRMAKLGGCEGRWGWVGDPGERCP